MQSQGAKPHGGAIEDCPTLSRRSLLLQAASLLALYVVAVPSPAMAWGLPKSLPEATVQQMKEEARQGMETVRKQLNPGVFKEVVSLEGLGPLWQSILALVGGGSIVTVTTGWKAIVLQALGVPVISPVIAFVSLVAVPTLVGLGTYATVTTIKDRHIKKLEHAIQELKTIEARLKPARYFRNEIAQIEDDIKQLELERQKSKRT